VPVNGGYLSRVSAVAEKHSSLRRELSQAQPTIGHGEFEAAADQAIAACSGDARKAVKALIVANQFLETELEKLRAAVSVGYARGKLLPRDRKDWYD
jgi:hypothetical protein